MKLQDPPDKNARNNSQNLLTSASSTTHTQKANLKGTAPEVPFTTSKPTVEDLQEYEMYKSKCQQWWLSLERMHIKQSTGNDTSNLNSGIVDEEDDVLSSSSSSQDANEILGGYDDPNNDLVAEDDESDDDDEINRGDTVTIEQ